MTPEDATRPGPAPRIYPLPRPDDDPRFTAGLMIDVLDVLEAHGYPRPTAGGDMVALQLALFRFLYESTEGRP